MKPGCLVRATQVTGLYKQLLAHESRRSQFSPVNRYVYLKPEISDDVILVIAKVKDKDKFVDSDEWVLVVAQGFVGFMLARYVEEVARKSDHP